MSGRKLQPLLLTKIKKYSNPKYLHVLYGRTFQSLGMSQRWITNLQKKMRIFASITQHIWGLFVSERKPGWKNLLQLFAVCCTVSFIISSLLFLGLHSFLAPYPLVSLAISGSTWIGLSIGLCSSKHMRCFGTLFVLSCSLREVSKHLQALPKLEVNLKVRYQKNENTFIFNNGERKTMNLNFSSSLFKHECLPKPEFLLSSTWIQLGCIIFCLIIFALFSTTLTQLKILVSTSFYPNIEMKRIHYLHAKLLRKRSKFPQKNVKRKLNSFATTLHFWFPVFKAMGMVTKKQKDMININNV
ncbi:unnamed protein product [Caretta caretta]